MGNLLRVKLIRAILNRCGFSLADSEPKWLIKAYYYPQATDEITITNCKNNIESMLRNVIRLLMSVDDLDMMVPYVELKAMKIDEQDAVDRTVEQGVKAFFSSEDIELARYTAKTFKENYDRLIEDFDGGKEEQGKQINKDKTGCIKIVYYISELKQKPDQPKRILENYCMLYQNQGLTFKTEYIGKIPVKKLRPTQPWLTRGLEELTWRIVQVCQGNACEVLICEDIDHQGKRTYYVLDSHHRVVTAILLKEKNIDAIVVRPSKQGLLSFSGKKPLSWKDIQIVSFGKEKSILPNRYPLSKVRLNEVSFIKGDIKITFCIKTSNDGGYISCKEGPATLYFENLEIVKKQLKNINPTNLRYAQNRLLKLDNSYRGRNSRNQNNASERVKCILEQLPRQALTGRKAIIIGPGNNLCEAKQIIRMMPNIRYLHLIEPWPQNINEICQKLYKHKEDYLGKNIEIHYLSAADLLELFPEDSVCFVYASCSIGTELLGKKTIHVWQQIEKVLKPRGFAAILNIYLDHSWQQRKEKYAELNLDYKFTKIYSAPLEQYRHLSGYNHLGVNQHYKQGECIFVEYRYPVGTNSKVKRYSGEVLHWWQKDGGKEEAVYIAEKILPMQKVLALQKQGMVLSRRKVYELINYFGVSMDEAEKIIRNRNATVEGKEIELKNSDDLSLVIAAYWSRRLMAIAAQVGDPLKKEYTDILINIVQMATVDYKSVKPKELIDFIYIFEDILSQKQKETINYAVVTLANKITIEDAVLEVKENKPFVYLVVKKAKKAIKKKWYRKTSAMLKKEGIGFKLLSEKEAKKSLNRENCLPVGYAIHAEDANYLIDGVLRDEKGKYRYVNFNLLVGLISDSPLTKETKITLYKQLLSKVRGSAKEFYNRIEYKRTQLTLKHKLSQLDKKKSSKEYTKEDAIKKEILKKDSLKEIKALSQEEKEQKTAKSVKTPETKKQKVKEKISSSEKKPYYKKKIPHVKKNTAKQKAVYTRKQETSAEQEKTAGLKPSDTDRQPLSEKPISEKSVIELLKQKGSKKDRKVNILELQRELITQPEDKQEKEKTEELEEQAADLSRAAFNYFEEEKFETAAKINIKSAELYRVINEYKKAADNYKFAAFNFYKGKKIQKAIEAGLISEKLYAKITGVQNQELISLYKLISICYGILNKENKQLCYFEKLAYLYEKEEEWKKATKEWAILAYHYSKRKEYDKQEKAQVRSAQLSEKVAEIENGKQKRLNYLKQAAARWKLSANAARKQGRTKQEQEREYNRRSAELNWKYADKKVAINIWRKLAGELYQEAKETKDDSEKIKLFEDSAGLFVRAAKAYKDKTIKEWKEPLQPLEKEFQCWSLAATSYFKANKKIEAAKLRVKSANIALKIANLREKEGKTKQARKRLKEAEGIYFRVGRDFVRLGKWKSAAEAFSASSEILVRLNKFKKALGSLERARQCLLKNKQYAKIPEIEARKQNIKLLERQKKRYLKDGGFSKNEKEKMKEIAFQIMRGKNWSLSTLNNKLPLHKTHIIRFLKRDEKLWKLFLKRIKEEWLATSGNLKKIAEQLKTTELTVHKIIKNDPEMIRWVSQQEKKILEKIRRYLKEKIDLETICEKTGINKHVLFSKIRSDPESKKILREIILECSKEYPKVSKKEICKRIGISKRQLDILVKELFGEEENIFQRSLLKIKNEIHRYTKEINFSIDENRIDYLIKRAPFGYKRIIKQAQEIQRYVFKEFGLWPQDYLALNIVLRKLKWQEENKSWIFRKVLKSSTEVCDHQKFVTAFFEFTESSLDEKSRQEIYQKYLANKKVNNNLRDCLFALRLAIAEHFIKEKVLNIKEISRELNLSINKSRYFLFFRHRCATILSKNIINVAFKCKWQRDCYPKEFGMGYKNAEFFIKLALIHILRKVNLEATEDLKSQHYNLPGQKIKKKKEPTLIGLRNKLLKELWKKNPENYYRIGLKLGTHNKAIKRLFDSEQELLQWRNRQLRELKEKIRSMLADEKITIPEISRSFNIDITKLYQIINSDVSLKHILQKRLKKLWLTYPENFHQIGKKIGLDSKRTKQLFTEDKELAKWRRKKQQILSDEIAKMLSKKEADFEQIRKVSKLDSRKLIEFISDDRKLRSIFKKLIINKSKKNKTFVNIARELRIGEHTLRKFINKWFTQEERKLVPVRDGKAKVGDLSKDKLNKVRLYSQKRGLKLSISLMNYLVKRYPNKYKEVIDSAIIAQRYIRKTFGIFIEDKRVVWKILGAPAEWRNKNIKWQFKYFVGINDQVLEITPYLSKMLSCSDKEIYQIKTSIKEKKKVTILDIYQMIRPSIYIKETKLCEEEKVILALKRAWDFLSQSEKKINIGKLVREHKEDIFGNSRIRAQIKIEVIARLEKLKKGKSSVFGKIGNIEREKLIVNYLKKLWKQYPENYSQIGYEVLVNGRKIKELFKTNKELIKWRKLQRKRLAKSVISLLTKEKLDVKQICTKLGIGTKTFWKIIEEQDNVREAFKQRIIEDYKQIGSKKAVTDLLRISNNSLNNFIKKWFTEKELEYFAIRNKKPQTKKLVKRKGRSKETQNIRTKDKQEKKERLPNHILREVIPATERAWQLIQKEYPEIYQDISSDNFIRNRIREIFGKEQVEVDLLLEVISRLDRLKNGDVTALSLEPKNKQQAKHSFKATEVKENKIRKGEIQTHDTENRRKGKTYLDRNKRQKSKSKTTSKIIKTRGNNNSFKGTKEKPNNLVTFKKDRDKKTKFLNNFDIETLARAIESSNINFVNRMPSLQIAYWLKKRLGESGRNYIKDRKLKKSERRILYQLEEEGLIIRRWQRNPPDLFKIELNADKISDLAVQKENLKKTPNEKSVEQKKEENLKSCRQEDLTDLYNKVFEEIKEKIKKNPEPSKDGGRRITVIFNRGGGKSINTPPNTIAAIRWAIRRGAEAVMFDVRRVYDKNNQPHFVVFGNYDYKTIKGLFKDKKFCIQLEYNKEKYNFTSLNEILKLILQIPFYKEISFKVISNNQQIERRLKRLLVAMQQGELPFEEFQHIRINSAVFGKQFVPSLDKVINFVKEHSPLMQVFLYIHNVGVDDVDLVYDTLKEKALFRPITIISNNVMFLRCLKAKDRDRLLKVAYLGKQKSFVLKILLQNTPAWLDMIFVREKDLSENTQTKMLLNNLNIKVALIWEGKRFDQLASTIDNMKVDYLVTDMPENLYAKDKFNKLFDQRRFLSKDFLKLLDKAEKSMADTSIGKVSTEELSWALNKVIHLINRVDKRFLDPFLYRVSLLNDNKYIDWQEFIESTKEVAIDKTKIYSQVSHLLAYVIAQKRKLNLLENTKQKLKNILNYNLYSVRDTKRDTKKIKSETKQLQQKDSVEKEERRHLKEICIKLSKENRKFLGIPKSKELKKVKIAVDEFLFTASGNYKSQKEIRKEIQKAEELLLELHQALEIEQAIRKKLIEKKILNEKFRLKKLISNSTRLINKKISQLPREKRKIYRRKFETLCGNYRKEKLSIKHLEELYQLISEFLGLLEAEIKNSSRYLNHRVYRKDIASSTIISNKKNREFRKIPLLPSNFDIVSKEDDVLAYFRKKPNSDEIIKEFILLNKGRNRQQILKKYQILRKFGTQNGSYWTSLRNLKMHLKKRRKENNLISQISIGEYAWLSSQVVKKFDIRFSQKDKDKWSLNYYDGESGFVTVVGSEGIITCYQATAKWPLKNFGKIKVIDNLNDYVEYTYSDTAQLNTLRFNARGIINFIIENGRLYRQDIMALKEIHNQNSSIINEIFSTLPLNSKRIILSKLSRWKATGLLTKETKDGGLKEDNLLLQVLGIKDACQKDSFNIERLTIRSLFCDICNGRFAYPQQYALGEQFLVGRHKLICDEFDRLPYKEKKVIANTLVNAGMAYLIKRPKTKSMRILLAIMRYAGIAEFDQASLEILRNFYINFSVSEMARCFNVCSSTVYSIFSQVLAERDIYKVFLYRLYSYEDKLPARLGDILNDTKERRTNRLNSEIFAGMGIIILDDKKVVEINKKLIKELYPDIDSWSKLTPKENIINSSKRHKVIRDEMIKLVVRYALILDINFVNKAAINQLVIQVAQNISELEHRTGIKPLRPQDVKKAKLKLIKWNQQGKLNYKLRNCLTSLNNKNCKDGGKTLLDIRHWFSTTRRFVIFVAISFVAYTILAVFLLYPALPVPNGVAVSEYINKGIFLKDYLRNLLFTMIAFIWGNLISQIYEIGILREHDRLDLGRTTRTALWTVASTFIWSVGWYGVMLPLCSEKIHNLYPDIPLWLVKAFLDQGPWTVFALALSFFVGRWFIERHSAREAFFALLVDSEYLKKCFWNIEVPKRWRLYLKFPKLIVYLNWAFWLPTVTIIFVIMPDFIYLATQPMVILWAAVLCFSFHEDRVPNLWKMYTKPFKYLLKDKMDGGNIELFTPLKNHGSLYKITKEFLISRHKGPLVILNADAHEDKSLNEYTSLEDEIALCDGITFIGVNKDKYLDNCWAALLKMLQVPVVHMPSYMTTGLSRSGFVLKQIRSKQNWDNPFTREKILKTINSFNKKPEVWLTFDFDFFSLYGCQLKFNEKEVTWEVAPNPQPPVYEMDRKQVNIELVRMLSFFDKHDIEITRIIPCESRSYLASAQPLRNIQNNLLFMVPGRKKEVDAYCSMVLAEIKKVFGKEAEVIDYNGSSDGGQDEFFKLYLKLRRLAEYGCIPVKNQEIMKVIYSPGVGRVAQRLANNPKDLKRFTKYEEPNYESSKQQNKVLIVSDGSAVLGFGNIGIAGMMPVAQGKKSLLKWFANVNSEIVLVPDTTKLWQTHNRIAEKLESGLNGDNSVDIDNMRYHLASIRQEIENKVIQTVNEYTQHYPSSVVMLEDIAAPICFTIEKKLNSQGIVTVHDDQHGTAIVFVAALINALENCNKDIQDAAVVILGAGAAGMAIAKVLRELKVASIKVFDSRGKLTTQRNYAFPEKAELVKMLRKKGADTEESFAESLTDADVLITVAKPNLYKDEEKMLKNMADNATVFLGENPQGAFNPYKVAQIANIESVAVGNFKQKEFPVLNNAYGFPGIFRALSELKHKKKLSSQEIIKLDLKVAEEIAKQAKKYKIQGNYQQLLPPIFTDSGYNNAITEIVASAIANSVYSGETHFSGLEKDLKFYQNRITRKMPKWFRAIGQDGGSSDCIGFFSIEGIKIPRYYLEENPLVKKEKVNGPLLRKLIEKSAQVVGAQAQVFGSFLYLSDEEGYVPLKLLGDIDIQFSASTDESKLAFLQVLAEKVKKVSKSDLVIRSPPQKSREPSSYLLQLKPALGSNEELPSLNIQFHRFGTLNSTDVFANIKILLLTRNARSIKRYLFLERFVGSLKEFIYFYNLYCSIQNPFTIEAKYRKKITARLLEMRIGIINTDINRCQRYQKIIEQRMHMINHPWLYDSYGNKNKDGGEITKEKIISTFKKCEGSAKATYEHLGISKKKYYKLLKEYEIEEELKYIREKIHIEKLEEERKRYLEAAKKTGGNGPKTASELGIKLRTYRENVKKLDLT
ncbi:MAG: hypothetical protein N2606_05310, partial [Candidatus Omnitrophica bacterium]|nr:hypothetical protein [Candidatus Omnitrophota bacterium]